MRLIRSGMLGCLAVLSACTGGEAGRPAAQALIADSTNHIFSRFSPDGSKVVYWAATDHGWELTVAGTGAGTEAPRTVASTPFAFPMTWSPDGTNIAFNTYAFGFSDAAVVSAQGGEVRRITDGPGFEVPTQWNPDGDRLAFNAPREGGGIQSHVVSIATKSITPMVPETRPTGGYWSPDGSKIAYTVNDKGVSTIWVADSMGGNARQLTTEGLEGLCCIGLTPWSPNGTEVVYTSRRTGRSDVWVAPVNGGALRQLTHDIRDDFNPNWSADGKWVVFVSNRGRQTDVWVVPAAGGEEIRVTDDVAEEAAAQWVGKSHQLGFQSGTVTTTLWSITVADGKERRLTPDSITVGNHRVSPDGSMVVYPVLRGGGVADLQVVSMSGGAPRNLVVGSANIDFPSFSPDSKTIVFQSNKSGNNDIWIVSAAGGEPHQITDWPSEEFDPSWSRDGSLIYFRSNKGAATADVWTVPAAGGEAKRVTNLGNVWSLYTSPTTQDLFLTLIGGTGGKFDLVKLHPDGTTQMLWNAGNVVSGSPDALSPKGDSLVITNDLGANGRQNYIISTTTGKGREILDKTSVGGDFSPDGTMVSYLIGGPMEDLGVMNVKDGTTRRLTKTSEDEAALWWTRDGKMLVFSRTAARSKIMVTDLTKELEKKR